LFKVKFGGIIKQKLMNTAIFKSYDVRGIYPEELNEETAFKIGQAFANIAKAKKVVVARDARLSADKLFDALSKGIISQGADVFDIGQTPTECLYFAVGFYKEFDAGIMITASHNPKEYNGFKMLKKNGKNIEIIRGKDLLEIINKNNFKELEKKGKLEAKDIWQDYLKYIFSFADLTKIKPFNIAIDCSNGVAGNVFVRIGDKLKNKLFLLNYEPNGNFPNHSPNPLAEGSADQIKEEIKKEKLAFGFIFDGDADRIFLVDENGELVRSDVTLLLLAKYFLQKNPGMAIAYNAICSKAVPEFVKKWGGIPTRTQVGFVNVREGLLKNNGIMGGELSGHFCFKDYFYLDSGMIAFLTLLQAISAENKLVSEIVKELSPYAKGAEINFKIENKEQILEKIKQKYTDGKQDFLDGITVEYQDWWFNARVSNTEPLLRLTIEANTQELLEQKKKELTDVISS
jgi:phosphomannomutase